ncbi:MAG: hypothetical protein ABSC64_02415 [Candidatus Korobacteraceae bacterium]
MKVKCSVEYELKPKRPSLQAGRVYGSFGLDAEQGKRVYVAPFTIEAKPGQIIAFVGISGTGKTTCLEQLKAQTEAYDLREIVFEPEKTVIEHFADYDEALKNLSIAGLAEAQLLVRYPQELSDGQRYRFKLALGLSSKNSVVVCDEFLATLDRISAKTIAFSIGKAIRKTDKILAVATTHEDILEDLYPDIIVTFGAEGAEVSHQNEIKKKLAFMTICSLHEALEAIGTDSVSGTIEAQKSDS